MIVLFLKAGNSLAKIVLCGGVIKGIIMNVSIVFLLFGSVWSWHQFAVLDDEDIRFKPVRVHGNAIQFI